VTRAFALDVLEGAIYDSPLLASDVAELRGQVRRIIEEEHRPGGPVVFGVERGHGAPASRSESPGSGAKQERVLIMRMLMKVSIPVEAGNVGVKEGILPKTMMSFVEQAKPEAAYFAAHGGKRTAYFFVDMKEPSDMVAFAEPFFMNLQAEIEFVPAMNLEDMKAGVAKAMKNM
jgi:hypothetical protein